MTELAVLVPVLNRPQNVASLVASFLQDCPEDSVLHFIVEPTDLNEYGAVIQYYNWPPPHAIERLEMMGDSVTDFPISWPRKINFGVTEGREADWYLCAADDITFENGWWEATKELRDDPTIGVIGTNDSRNGTGNPRVAAGDHTCHPLIRATYIREHGTIDVPGEAVHAGYYHWFVDDELVWTAKTRGAWAFCREAIIEHLHPYWGHGQMDDTYRLGEANSTADAELWRKRAPLLGLTVT